MKTFTMATAALAIAAAFATSTAFAEEMKMQAELAPPEGVESSASGMTDVTYDSATGMLTWTLTYSDLSSEATAGISTGRRSPARMRRRSSRSRTSLARRKARLKSPPSRPRS